MVRGEDPGEEKFTARRGGRGAEVCAVAMRGVWIFLEYMKWKKGTDGAGVGGKGEKENVQRRRSRLLCYCRGGTKGASTFYPAIVEGRGAGVEKKKETPTSAPSR